MTVHRASLAAQPACGVTEGKVSVSGVIVTCPACLRQQETADVVREMAYASILAAAKLYRERHP